MAHAPAPAPQTAEQIVVGETDPDGQGASDAGSAMPSEEEEGGHAVVEGPREEPPTVEAQRLVDEAYALRESRRYEKSVADCTRVIGIDPSFWQAWPTSIERLDSESADWKGLLCPWKVWNLLEDVRRSGWGTVA